jgi:hypothetical protein
MTYLCTCRPAKMLLKSAIFALTSGRSKVSLNLLKSIPIGNWVFKQSEYQIIIFLHAQTDNFKCSEC